MYPVVYTLGVTSAPTLQPNAVKAWRERLGLGPSELARRAGMTRQALHRIEADHYVPSVLVALNLARALECRVEDLFALEEQEPSARLVLDVVPGSGPGQRLQLARVGPHLHAYPLSGAGALSATADALVQSVLPQGQVRVQPLTPAARWDEAAVLCGCDPSLALLARHAAPKRVLLRACVSERALAALVAGEAHAAGLHLYDPALGESNLPFVAAALPGQVTYVYALWRWEQGLIVQPGNPKQLSAAADLARLGVRLANRPPGAGSRRLLDDWLGRAGLSAGQLSGYDLECATPLDLAEAVAHGQADVGVGPRSAAQAHGLGFVPLLSERFDLVIPEAHHDHSGVQALLQAARSAALRAELTALGGYDPAQSGRLIATLSPQRST